MTLTPLTAQQGAALIEQDVAPEDAHEMVRVGELMPGIIAGIAARNLGAAQIDAQTTEAVRAAYGPQPSVDDGCVA